jgi:hypothetical protein
VPQRLEGEEDLQFFMQELPQAFPLIVIYMNAIFFTKWVNDQFLPAFSGLNKPCVVVMDNAPYHLEKLSKSPVPVSSTKKADMINWLNLNNIPHPPGATKKFLYNIIRERKQLLEKMYVINNLIPTNGHVVLRLPPYRVSQNSRISNVVGDHFSSQIWKKKSGLPPQRYIGLKVRSLNCVFFKYSNHIFTQSSLQNMLSSNF